VSIGFLSVMGATAVGYVLITGGRAEPEPAPAK
jgi:hypothetical protein